MRECPKWIKNAFVGLHYDLHARADDTCLGAELTHEHLREQLEKVRPDFVQCDCKGHPGYASYPTKVGSPSPGIVNDALRIHRDVTRELGIPLLVHYSGLWDARALELHPDWAAVNHDGTAIHTIQDSPACVCMLGPYLDELMIPQMLEVIDEYDVDGFWVDGDNWAVRDCYCPRCKAEFKKRTGIENPPKDKDSENWIAWRRFQQDIFTEYVTKYADAVHARKPQCAVCSNWIYSMRQPGKVKVPVDFLSGDFMSSFGCERAEMEGRYLDGHGMPWNLMSWSYCTTEYPRISYQTKNAEHLKQEAAEVLSCGGGFYIYDQPQRSGWITGWHQDLFADVMEFCRQRREFCQHTRSVPDAVVLQGEEHSLHNNPEVFCMGESFYPAEGALHALIENHYHVDILDEARLKERMNDYGLVVMAGQNPIGQALLDEVEDYASNGGTVLMTGHHLANMCGELIGVQPDGELNNATWNVEINGEAATLSGPWQPVKTLDSVAYTNVLTHQQPGKDDSGCPAVTIRHVGKGKIVAVHGDIMRGYYFTHHHRIREFIHKLLEDVGVQRKVKLDAPPSVEVSLREKDNRLMVNLVNRAVSPTLTPRLHIVEEVPPTGKVSVKVRVDTPPTRVTFQPDGVEPQWQYADGWLSVDVESVKIHDIVVVDCA